jgi:hypothetical protein
VIITSTHGLLLFQFLTFLITTWHYFFSYWLTYINNWQVATLHGQSECRFLYINMLNRHRDYFRTLRSWVQVRMYLLSG